MRHLVLRLTGEEGALSSRRARDHDGLMVTGLRGPQPPDFSEANPAKMFAQLTAQECVREAAVVANRPAVAATAHYEQMLIVGPAIPMPVPMLECQAHVAGRGGERLGREGGVLLHDAVVVANRCDK